MRTYPKYVLGDSDDNFQLKAELAITNLFLAANNPQVFNKLEEKDQRRLIKVLTAYTTRNILSFYESKDPDVEGV